jgi:hypothetical protein
MIKDEIINAPADPAVRARRAFQAFIAAHNGDQIILAIGTADGAPAVVLTIAGGPHFFLVDEARTFANGLEKAMRQFPDFSYNSSVADLIMALRAGADEAEKFGCQVPSTS